MIRTKWTLTKLYICIELANVSDDIQFCSFYLMPCLYASHRQLIKAKPKQCLCYDHKNLKLNRELCGKYNDLHITGDPWWSTNKLLPPICKANLFQNPLPQKSDDEWKRFLITLFQPRMNLNIQVGNFFMNIKDG